jgi:hypothetical protein
VISRTSALYLIFILFALALSSCGSLQSMQPQNGVPGATIVVHDSLTVTGQILDETETTITIAAGGAAYTYDKGRVREVQRVLVPDMLSLQVEGARKAASAASSGGTLLVANFIILVVWVLSLGSR